MKRFARNALIVVIIFLTACILFGRTLLSIKTARATFTRARSGSITRSYSVSGEFEWRKSKDVILTAAIDYPILITEVCVKPGELIAAGSVVCRARMGHAFNSEYRQLAESVESLDLEIKLMDYDAGQNADALTLRKEAAQLGLSRAKARLHELEQLAASLTSVAADTDARVIDMLLEVDRMYDGRSVAYSVSEDSYPILLLNVTEVDRQFISEGLSIAFDYESERYTGEVLQVVTSAQPESKGRTYAYLRANDEFQAAFSADAILGDTATALIEKTSPVYDTVVPASAVVDIGGAKTIYLAVPTKGYWGEEYSVKSMSVTVLDYNSRYAAISERIQSTELVLSQWDREISVGDAVMER